MIEALLADYFQYDGWQVLEQKNGHTDMHVVYAQNSDRWTDDSRTRLLALSNFGAGVHCLPRAGHWVHVDNPTGLRNLFDRYLLS